MTTATAPKAKAKPKAKASKSATPGKLSDATLLHSCELLKQVADPTRLQVIVLLSSHEELSVSAMVEKLDGQTQPALSHHLALMRHARIVTTRREGKNNMYRLTEDGKRASAVASLVLQTGK